MDSDLRQGARIWGYRGRAVLSRDYWLLLTTPSYIVQAQVNPRFDAFFFLAHDNQHHCRQYLLYCNYARNDGFVVIAITGY